MPLVRAEVLVYVDKNRRYPGDVFEYNGPPTSNLTPVEEVLGYNEKANEVKSYKPLEPTALKSAAKQKD